MHETTDRSVTAALAAVERGDRHASEELLPLVYERLRGLARARMAREGPQTLQPTALVHEAYLRIATENAEDSDRVWANRRHFFAAAAEAMRRILIERARRVARIRHGGEVRFVTLQTGTPGGWQPRPEEFIALDGALKRLEHRDEGMARVVELRFFGGLTQSEVAEVLGCSERTVRRHWVAAKAWLTRELGEMSSEAGVEVGGPNSRGASL